MKREIKFKAWCISQRRFINLNGVDIQFKNCLNEGAIYNAYEQGVLKVFEASDIEFLEYTGHKDNSGNEIYEGFILKNKEYEMNGLVEWRDYIYDAMDEHKPTHVSGLYITSLMWDYPLENFTGWEVIGNIFENPELRQ